MPIDVESVSSARPRVLAGLAEARALASRPSEALARLEVVRELDPLGVTLALEATRLALAAQDRRAAELWGQRALANAGPSRALEQAARQGLAGIRWQPPARREPPPIVAPTFEEACARLVKLVQLGGVALGLAAPPQQGVDCTLGPSIAVPSPLLRHAGTLDLTVTEDGTHRATWIGVGMPQGVVAIGPVAEAWVPDAHGLSNGYQVTLQQADLVPAGAPEVTVQVTETRTVLDLCLNEVREIDLLYLRVLSIDTGRLEATPSFWLMRRETTRLALPGADELPPGTAHSPDLGRAQQYQMSVQWGPNLLTLKRMTGDLVPDREGEVTLFAGSKAASSSEHPR